ncbi:MAG TPA: HAD-IA family hydrolase [Gaiellaceae bacterium]|nr:HAD-IA family hydrolase [Gaiellaceae bacterium]
MGELSLAAIDAVTIDAMGTLVRLSDPIPRLAAAAGVSEQDARRGFEAEVAYYVPRAHEGRDAASLAELRARCTAVFNEHAGTSLPAERFMAAIVFEPEPGALEAVRRLAARGLALCVVSNWDCGLGEQLAALGFRLPVVTSAEAGAVKPDPAIFRLALERLAVGPGRALHVGDSQADEEGARAAGMRFAPAPLEAIL